MSFFSQGLEKIDAWHKQKLTGFVGSSVGIISLWMESQDCDCSQYLGLYQLCINRMQHGVIEIVLRFWKYTSILRKCWGKANLFNMRFPLWSFVLSQQQPQKRFIKNNIFLDWHWLIKLKYLNIMVQICFLVLSSDHQ